MTAPVIKVITDSVCDVPADVAARLDITVVPAVVNIGRESYLDDGVQITREEFYRRLPTLRELPTTSACPLGVTQELIAAKAAEADHLILITTPAHLSGIYNTFRVAAEAVAPGRYTLIDSGQITMGMGFLVIAAAEAAAEGADVATIRAVLDQMQPRIHVFGALNTLENLRKSGRIGWAMAITGQLLQIKPLIEVTQGKVTPLARIRTFKRATERLRQLALDFAPLERLAVLHTGNPEGAEALRDSLAAVFPPAQTPIVHVNPALGTHVADRGLGIALVTQSQAN